MYTPRSNVGSSRRSASRSRTACSQVRLTVVFGVSMATVGRVGRPSGRRNSTALHDRVVGRRRLSEPVNGNHFRQVCQTPFGAVLATKKSRPLAYWGGG